MLGRMLGLMLGVPRHARMQATIGSRRILENPSLLASEPRSSGCLQASLPGLRASLLVLRFSAWLCLPGMLLPLGLSRREARAVKALLGDSFSPWDPRSPRMSPRQNRAISSFANFVSTFCR